MQPQSKRLPTILVQECLPNAEPLLDMLDIEGSVLKRRTVSLVDMSTQYILERVQIEEPPPKKKVWEFTTPVNPPIENRASTYTPEYIMKRLERANKKYPSPIKKKEREPSTKYTNMTAEELWHSVTWEEFSRLEGLRDPGPEFYDMREALRKAGKDYCDAYGEDTNNNERPAPAGAPEKGRWICCCCCPYCDCGPFTVWMPGC